MESLSYLFPAAFTIGLSPMILIAVVAFCIAGEAKKQALFFDLGAFLGIVIATIGFAIAYQAVAAKSDGSGGAGGSPWLMLIFAVLLLYLAYHSFATRPKKGETPKEPAWLHTITTLSPFKTILFGGVLTVLNAKNLPVILSASTVIVAHSSGNSTQVILQSVIFAVLSTITFFLIPLCVILLGDKFDNTLKKMQAFLYQYNNVIMALLFAYLGFTTLGKALSLF